jgi:hypothetical protein
MSTGNYTTPKRIDTVITHHPPTTGTDYTVAKEFPKDPVIITGTGTGTGTSTQASSTTAGIVTGTGSEWTSGYSPNTLQADPTAAFISALHIYSNNLYDSITKYTGVSDPISDSMLTDYRNIYENKREIKEAALEDWRAAGKPKSKSDPTILAWRTANREFKDAEKKYLPYSLINPASMILSSITSINETSTKAELQTVYDEMPDPLADLSAEIDKLTDLTIKIAFNNFYTSLMIAAGAFGVAMRMRAKVARLMDGVERSAFDKKWGGYMIKSSRKGRKSSRKGRKSSRKATRRN